MLLVEVLSPSTADKDRSEKFIFYRQIPSLPQHLILVAQSYLAEPYTRPLNGYWLFIEIREITAILDLSSMSCQVPLAEVCAGVDHGLTPTFWASVKNRSTSSPPSRLTPEFFIPPRGVRRSRCSQVFTHTMPVCSWWATRWARCRSRVQMAAERP